MNTKRVNDEFHRLDVKLPIAVYEQISEIAVNNFSARVHHISGKPEITPTLIYLLELGVQSFTSGNELIKKPNTDNYTDTIPITETGVKTLIKDELIPIQSKLDELSEIVYRLTYTDTNTDNDTDKLEINTDSLTDTNTDNDTDKLEINTDSLTDTIPIMDTPKNKPELPTELANDVNVPEKENKGKKKPADKVLECIMSLPNGKKIANRAHLAEISKVDNTFFSRGGKALWEQFVKPVTEKRGEKDVITHYIIKKPE